MVSPVSDSLVFGVRRRGSTWDKGAVKPAVRGGLQLSSLWWTCSMLGVQRVGDLRGRLGSKYTSTLLEP